MENPVDDSKVKPTESGSKPASKKKPKESDSAEIGEANSDVKASKKKPKEDKWKQKMAFLYEDGGDPDKDVGDEAAAAEGTQTSYVWINILAV